MNKQRKEKIRKCALEIEIIINKLSNLLDEEQDYYDNMPENLQCSVRGNESEEAIDVLNESIDDLNNIIERIDEI